ncbi:MAG: hypothetical protein KY392_01140, partial [Chloroflexi bacterium]|nr:hypothetical protein [Chloroflexota bacterium]
EERAAQRAATLTVTNSRADTAAVADPIDVDPVALEVRTPDRSEPGLLESIVGAFIGFLFG